MLCDPEFLISNFELDLEIINIKMRSLRNRIIFEYLIKTFQSIQFIRMIEDNNYLWTDSLAIKN